MRQDWRHIDNPNILLTRAYPWIDRYLLIDEEIGREVIGDLKHADIQFCNFIKQPESDEIAE